MRTTPTTRAAALSPTTRRRVVSLGSATTALVVLAAGLAAVPAVVGPATTAQHGPRLGSPVAATHAGKVQAAPAPASSRSVKTAAAAASATDVVTLNTAADTDPSQWSSAGSTTVRVAALPGTTATKVSVTLGRGSDGATPQLTLVRADGGTTASTVALAVPDALMAASFGADYADRAQWQQTPDPAMNNPAADSLAVSPLAERRDVHAKMTVLTATVSGTASRLKPSAGPTSAAGTGTFAATSLNPASSWQVSTQTGDFAWNYPMRTPPAAAGPAPTLGLAYDSQSVDGETGSTNNQPGIVGDGWTLGGGGFIERSYIPCAADDGPSGPVTTSGDQCWHGDNATISFAGHSGALIQDATTGTWRLQDDDNSRLQYLTGTSNGTYDGDYWRLTTTDGTQYYFGLNQLPGYAAGNPTTNSAFTEPVFGNDTREPCHRATFAVSSCTQGWRWNLDYVVDPHGNAEALYYTTSTNRYGANNAGNSMVYVRDGVLDHIDYGLTSSTVYAANAATDKVLFGYTGRCASTTDCDKAHPTNSPDTPWDQNCAATTCTQTSPTFWSTSMLTTVTTEDRTGPSTYSPVDTWTLNHSFPDPGDGQSPALWLTSVDHTGNVGTAASVPTTTFAGTTYQNRVTNHDGLAVFDKYRVTGITTELGAVININYSQPDCTTGDVATVQANLPTNTRRCFPQWWTPQVTPPQPAVQDLFHKYVVTSTVATPGLGDAAEVTTYAYTGTPAWRYDLSPATPAKNRTWSDYAGYDTVEVRTGDSNDTIVAATDYRYYRGMDGDRATTAGGTKTVTVTGTDNAAQPDSRWLAGQIREQQTLTAVGGSVLTDVITTPWASAVTATDTGGRTARIVDAGTVTTSNAVAAGGRRTTQVTTTHDTYGRVTTVDDATGDAGTTCTTTTYPTVDTSPSSAWMFDYPSEVATVAVPCAQTGSATYPAAAISDVRTAYDGGAVGATPTKGEVSSTARVTGYTGNTAATATWQTTATLGYDTLGRTRTVTDQLNRTTTTAYTPAGGGPLTSTTVTNPMGHTSTTTVDPAWGAVTASTDANGNTTTATYDGLGRRVTVWAPDNIPSADNTTPSTAYTYTLGGRGNPNVVKTVRRVPGFTVRSYALFDGLGQARQTQQMSEGGGTVVVDTITDSVGRTTYTTNPYFVAAAPSGDTVTPTVTVPSVVKTTYDGVGRQTASILVANGNEAWRTSTAYSGTDTTAVTPPAGGTPTTTVTDSRGHTTALTQWLSATPGVGTAEKTTYTYDAAGRQTAMTDPTLKNTWTWSFDTLGRTVTATDPDTGTTTTGYDAADRPITVTDNRGQTITTTYDTLDRPTGRYSGTTTGPKLAAWTYDTAAKGQLDTATTYVGSTGPAGAALGAAYSRTVDSYDAAERPTQQTVTLPAAAGPLAGDYVTHDTYDTSGIQMGHAVPAIGGLPAENLGPGLDELGNTVGYGTVRGPAYLSGVAYDHLNRPAELTISPSFSNAPGVSTHRDYSYDAGTGRLSEDLITITQAHNGVIADDTYTYDNAGDLLSDTSVRDTGAGTDPTTTQVTDTQCYQYDHQQNLTQAWTPASNDCATVPTSTTPVALGGPAPYWQSWSFDAATGNRLTATQNPISSGATSNTDTYAYPAAGAARPHGTTRVTHVTTRSGGATTTTASNYRYDAAGNSTTRPGQTLTWDATGQLSTIAKTPSGQTQTRVYLPDGTLLYQTDPTNGAVAYLDETELHVAAGSTTVTGVRTYNAPGIGPVAERVTPARLDGYTVFLIQPDIRGTNIASVVAGNGAVTNRYVDPYGNPRGGSVAFPSSHLYLNAPTDTFGGYSHLSARDYDPTIGSFLSVDPVLSLSDPAQNNGYNYSHNNPTSTSDPSGRRPAGDIGDEDSGDWGNANKTSGVPVSATAGSRDRAFEVVLARERLKGAEAQRAIHQSGDANTTGSAAWFWAVLGNMIYSGTRAASGKCGAQVMDDESIIECSGGLGGQSPDDAISKVTNNNAEIVAGKYRAQVAYDDAKVVAAQLQLDDAEQAVEAAGTGNLAGVDRGDGRDAYGRFTGQGGYGASAEAQGLQDYKTATGRDVIDDQVRATLPDGSTRIYDGLSRGPDGTYQGVEVKGGSASKTSSQRAFDEQVDSGVPATATLRGAPISITSTSLIRVR